MTRTLLVLVVAAITYGADTRPTIAAKTQNMKAMPGYFPLYWDAEEGKIYLEISRWNQEFLYVESLPAGVGSNDIGLDRGQLGGRKILRFERSGNKVLLLQPNYDYRASSTDQAERRSVRESFAESVIWGGTVEAEEGDRVLVDATSFYVRDAHNVAGALNQTKQGTYHVDAARSAIYLGNTKSFPKNTEVEAIITLTTEATAKLGEYVQQVVPTPDAITVREHQSFVELPDSGFKPRKFDPRAGFFAIEYDDFSAPLGAELEKRFIERHRLEKKDPSAAVSDPVKPIVYYLDRGAPEPIRSALLEGARWWNQAFEAAGYRNAFRVELMPDDADPMDVRYNVIQWVHRATRGWSYGATISDPRTGEIIQGHVTLGSLRSRQDFMIAEGLLAPYEAGKPVPSDMQAMVLARLRQLAAHEVGHTLGLSHNFAASTHDRASVMDYPHPLITLDAHGNVDLSHAYATGIGDWDKIAIRWGYGEPPAGSDEPRYLNKIISDTAASGLYFITDEDSRPLGSAHPYSHLWDNGSDPIAELNRILDVRAAVLKRFGERNLPEGRPLSELERTLVPMYLLHRYQTEAAAKSLGGLNYRYALRGDGELVTEIVPAAQQRQALKALLRTVDPAALTLPESLLKVLPPVAFTYRRTREDFGAHTGLAFDPMGAVEAASNLSVALLLNAERAERLIQYHAREQSVPDFDEVAQALVALSWGPNTQRGLAGETQRVIGDVVLYHLMALVADETASTQVRAVAFNQLGSIKTRALARVKLADPNERAHGAYALNMLERFDRDPKVVPMHAPVEPPPGQPIGDE